MAWTRCVLHTSLVCSVAVLTASCMLTQEEAAARARLTTRGGGTAVHSSAAVAQPGGEWDIDDEPLEDLQPARAAAAPPASYAPRPAAGAPSRPVVAHVRPAPPAGGGTKPMKLGASKLGASKLKGGDLDLEALLAD
jgi:hypothetical protein